MTDSRRGTIWSTSSDPGPEAIVPLLDASGIIETISEYRQIIIKPNLVEALKPPITTPVSLVEAIVGYFSRRRPDIRIIVGEGTGSLDYDTHHCFAELGYAPLGGLPQVDLVDLNTQPLVHLAEPAYQRWPRMHLPEIIFDSFLISVPVLKAHSLARVTLTMKNMMGCAPPSHYQGGGGWGKASFHQAIQAAIFDLNRYRTPDFTILDGSVGMAQAHLWGPTCDPAPRTYAVGYDPVAIDAFGTSLLGRRWQDIDHIAWAHELLGQADPLDLRVCQVATEA